MRFGVCAGRQQMAPLGDAMIDYLEENVQRFLCPERPEEEFAAHLDETRTLPAPVEAANVFIPADLPLVASATQSVGMPRLERYVRTALRRAETAGIRVIVFGSGKARACPPDLDLGAGLRQIGEHLTRWGGWAAEHGVTIVIEPLRREETNVLNTVAESAALVEQLNLPAIRLLADTYHMACNGEAPEDLRALAPLLAHVHVAEHRDRAAPGTHGEDFRPYLTALRRGGYDARISIECTWQDLAAQVAGALAAVREQWATAGAGSSAR
jgi:sugar phosphate isomerase/epimerase